MTVCQGLKIQLISSESGHIQLPAPHPPPKDPSAKGNASANVYPGASDLGKEAIAMEELKRIHLHLGRCSEFAMRSLELAESRIVPEQMIAGLFRRCNCSANVNRVTPPEISSWISKFNGEIVGGDIAYPSAGMRPALSGRRIMALMMVRCRSRFCVCTVLPDLVAETVTSSFMDDWVRHVGKPKRIATDYGSPGLYGHA